MPRPIFSPKCIPLKTLVFILSFACTPFALAAICPSEDDIVDTLVESPMDWSIYLSPGWHSELVHEDDADIVAFDKVFADRFGPKCVFATDSGSVNMFITQDAANLKGVDITELSRNPMWYCNPQLISNNPNNEQVCICNDSRERCVFTLIPFSADASIASPLTTTITTTQTVIQTEQ